MKALAAFFLVGCAVVLIAGIIWFLSILVALVSPLLLYIFS